MARATRPLVVAALVIGVALAPAGMAEASDAPGRPPAADCTVRAQGLQGTTQVCRGTFVDDNDGDGRPDPGGESHDYACAGVEGRGVCAWSVKGRALPVSHGLCAYAHNDTNPSAPRTPTQCVNDGHGCVVNGNLEHPGQCDPD